MDAVFMASLNSLISSISPERNLPRIQPSSMAVIFCVPMRQGTHLPQDSLRKKRMQLKAMSSMQRPSAQITIAAEPTMEPALESGCQSMGRSAIAAGKYPDDGPDGANPSRALLSITPPP